MFQISLLLIVSIGVSCSSAKLSDTVHVCKVEDKECIARSATEVINKNPNGNEELGLVKLEPVHLNDLVISESSAKTKSPIQLNFRFNGVDVFGLSKSKIVRVVGFDKDPKGSKFEVHALIPEMTLIGNYTAKGKILLLPILGEGIAEIKLSKIKTAVKFKPTVEEKDGKIIFGVDKIKVINEPEDVHFNLENLFSGNKQLGEEMNRVLNSNWKDVWSELEAGINNGYAHLIRIVLTEIFKKITYDEFYKD